MNHRFLMISTLLAAPLLSCGRGKIVDGEALPNAYPCYNKKEGTVCASPIDPVLNSVFTCRLTPVADALPKEICRRLFVDLLGRVATDDDYEADCKDKALAQIVKALMEKDDYV